MPYRAVIFDLFGTLVPAFASEPFQRSMEGMAGAVGVDWRAFDRLWTQDTSRARMTGAFPTIEANVEHICRTLGASPDAAQLAEAARIRLAFYRQTLVPRPDAVATLQRIKVLGLSLGLISDCSCEAPQLWPETPFAALIDAPVFSCLAGLKKPDSGLWRLACERLAAQPAECMYVADGYSHELSAARALGMEAVLIAVPGEAQAGPGETEAATWPGPRVGALAEVVGLLAHRPG